MSACLSHLAISANVAHDSIKDKNADDTSSGASLAGRIEDEKRLHKRWVWETEPNDTGWALYLDNDLFVMRSADQDYTGGASFTLSGGIAQKYWYSLDPVLNVVDSISDFSSLHLSNDRQLHSLEIGFTVFTPSDIQNIANQTDDRPYASIIYLSNTHESINLSEDSAFVSSFSLGILGSHLVQNIQTQVHKLTGSEKPVGWK